MGIYFSEINMPGEGDKLVLQVFPNGEVYDEHGIRHGIANWAEAVPVPPHGRLGDLDELYASLEKWLIQNRHSMTEATRVWIRGVLEGIAAAPTIIPADGKDTDVPTREEEV